MQHLPRMYKTIVQQMELRKKAAAEEIKKMDNERNLYLLDPFKRKSYLYAEPLDALVDTKEYLDELNIEKERLLKETKELEKKRKTLNKKIKESEFGSYSLKLEKIFEKVIPVKKHHLLKIKVGGELFIGLTDSSPENYIQSLILSAKDGDTSKLSKQLRMYGYLNEYEVLKSLPNEVAGLVETQITIISLQATLNQYGELGFLEGNDFSLSKEKNELNEDVLVIKVKALADFHEQLISLDEKIAHLVEPLNQILKLIEKLNFNLVCLKRLEAEKEAQEANERLFSQAQEEWIDLLTTTNTLRYHIDKQSNNLFLEKGFIIELQVLATTEDFSWVEKRKKKLNLIKKLQKDDSFDTQLKKLNDELILIQNDYSKKIQKLKIFDANFAEKVKAYNARWLDFGKSKLETLDKERRSLWNDAKNKRQKGLKSAFSNCGLINHGQYNKVIWLYDDLLKETEMYIEFELSVSVF